MSTPKKYRKKPITVEASLWRKDGDHDEVGLYRYPPVDPITGGISVADDAIPMGQLRHSEVPEQFRRETCDALMDDHGWIDTLEGGHTVCPGDWIIRGVHGEFYPCKPDIFAASYEEEEGMNTMNYFGLAAALEHLSSCSSMATWYAHKVAAHVGVHPDNALHAPRRDDLASELRTLGAAIDATNRILAAIAKDEAGQK